MLTSLMNTLAAWIALAAALAANPWLLARLCRPRANWITTGAFAAVTAIVLNTLIPILIHLGRVPISALTLATPHLVLAAILFASSRLLQRPLCPPAPIPSGSLAILIGFALLVFPITHLAGIDTYKWQGLAKAVRVEACIPWLIHPASLLGFTPRAYPPVQPLLLASVQIMGGLGVGAGFYIVSLISAVAAYCLCHLLGQRIFETPRYATWFSFFYLFSPVFVRYNHWATGRGLFLAVFPLVLLAVTALPRPRAGLGLLFACLLAALTHKVGLVAAALALTCGLASFLLPRTTSRILPVVLALPFVAAAVLFSPQLGPPGAGQVLGFLRTALTRFGWMLPAAALGLLSPVAWLDSLRQRRLFPLMLATLPLAFPSDMYGALIALPLVTLAATSGLVWIGNSHPRLEKPLLTTVAVLTLAGALGIVGQRTLGAMPPRVYRAAQFLEHYDPHGPYQVFAPGRARVQFHAYVSGCPRFSVTPADQATLTRRDFPSLRGKPADIAATWIDFGRNFIELGDTEVEWYGANPRLYFVRIDGEGDAPEHEQLLYQTEGIEIIKPADQPTPIPD